MTSIVNQVLSVPGTIASGVTNSVVAAKKAVSNAVIQPAISGISSAISASTSGISKAVEVVIVHPSIIASAAVKKAAVVADPYVTGLAGIAGTSLAVKGGYDLYKSEGKDKRAKLELAAGLTVVSCAAARLAMACIPAVKDQAVKSVENLSPWWIVPGIAASVIVVGVAGLCLERMHVYRKVYRRIHRSLE